MSLRDKVFEAAVPIRRSGRRKSGLPARTAVVSPPEPGRVDVTLRHATELETVQIADLGALEGGQHSCTMAIQAAIDLCGRRGGGRVVVSPGRWRTGPLQLRDGVKLELSSGARLHFDRCLAIGGADGPIVAGASIVAYRCRAIAVLGEGMLVGAVGSGRNGTGHRRATSDKGRSASYTPDGCLDLSEGDGPPPMISFVDCEDVRVEGITFEQPGCSRAVHLRGCRKVIVARITSVNGSRDNSDAVRIEGCEDVLIEDSRLQAGATCIGVLAEHKGGDEPPQASTNITVRGSVFEASQCGVTLRSSGGLVSEIDISRCRMDRVGTGLWIDGVKGVIEHVTVHDIEMGQVDGDAIRFTYTGAAGPRSDAGVQALRKVHVRRLTCTHAGTAVYLSGVFTAPEPEIVLQDLNITSDRGLICNESAGLRLANVRITPLSGPVLAVKDSRNIVIEGLTPPARRGVFLDLRGRQVRDVRLHGTPGSRIRPVVVLGIDVPRDAIVHNELP